MKMSPKHSVSPPIKTSRPANVLLAVWLALGLVRLFFLLLPFPELDAFQRSPCSLPVTDRHGALLRITTLPDGTRREYRPLRELPPELIGVFLTSEDRSFYLHSGVDAGSLVRAVFTSLREGEVVSGASTVTMQLARLVRPHDPGVIGKLEEMWDALRLEGKLSKEKILELWLNSLPFGHRAVGVTSASRVFFNQPPERLTPVQMLILAVVPRRPAFYSPSAGSPALPPAAAALGSRIGWDVSEDEVSRALTVLPDSPPPSPFRAPHFVRYVEGELSADEYASGREVRTSLDADLTDLVTDELNLQIRRAERHRIANGSALLLDNRTGEILVYVGSQDFADSARSGQVDGVRVRHQPGSTLKPFLYALALESGFTAASVLPDIPTRFGGEEAYVPLNFNRRFNGPVRLRSALASSLNIPAVYTLEKIGVPVFVRKLKELDFTSLEGQEEEVGVGLAIGNAEVTLLELVRAFSVFPRGGVKNTLTWRRFEPGQLTAAGKEHRVFSPFTAGLICDILADRKSRVTGFGSHSVLDTGFTAIFKTGTSNQFANTWALGATPRYTMGVWMGNFSGDTVIGMPGSSKPAQVVVDVLSRLARRDEQFPPLPDARQVRVCTLSGGRAKPECPSTVEEYFEPGTEPAPCVFHRRERGRVVTTYPPEYQVWAAAYGFYNEIRPGSGPGPGEPPVIVSPGNNALFYFDPTIPEEDQVVRIEVFGAPGDQLELSVNGEMLANGAAPLVEFWPLRPGDFEILAEGRNGAARKQFAVK